MGSKRRLVPTAVPASPEFPEFFPLPRAVLHYLYRYLSTGELAAVYLCSKSTRLHIDAYIAVATNLAVDYPLRRPSPDEHSRCPRIPYHRNRPQPTPIYARLGWSLLLRARSLQRFAMLSDGDGGEGREGGNHTRTTAR
jgi:hypothetical protein